jgi:hypothetical protein
VRWFSGFVLFLSATIYSIADPVQVSVGPAGIAPGFTLEFGNSSCQDSGVTSASCSISFQLTPSSFQGGGSVSATAGFGSLSGQGSGGGEAATPGPIIYNTSFSDYLVVTGGTGSGTLTAHYQLDADGGQPLNPATNADVPTNSPEFSFLEGSTAENLYPHLTDGNSGFSNEPFSISSPFQFGTQVTFGADTQALIDNYIYTEGLFAEAQCGSSVQLIGFTVLDASGNVIPGAEVTPENVVGLDFFTPEPFSASLVLLGLVALVWPIVRYRRVCE